MGGNLLRHARAENPTNGAGSRGSVTSGYYRYLWFVAFSLLPFAALILWTWLCEGGGESSAGASRERRNTVAAFPGLKGSFDHGNCFSDTRSGASRTV
jgi:hypothetical protein